MSNLYEHSAHLFELIDEDGIILAAGQSLPIIEPIGMRGARIKIVRSKYHGLDFEFFDPETQISFRDKKKTGSNQSGYDFLVQAYNSKGSDAKITFKYSRIDQPTLTFKGRVFFPSKDDSDHKFTVQVKRIDLDDDFKNRESKPFDLNRSVDFNDGPLPVVTYSDIILAPQVVVKQFRTSLNGTESAVGSGTENVATFNFGDQLESSFKNQSFVPYNTGIGAPDSSNFVLSGFGYYSLTVNFESKITLSSGSQVRLYLEMFKNNESVFKKSIALTSIGSTETAWNVVNADLDFWGNTGMSLKIYLETTSHYFTAVELTSASLVLNGETKSQFLLTKFIPVKDALVRLLRGYTGFNNLIESSFLDSLNFGLLSGGLVRGRPETEAFKLKWSDSITSLGALFGLGFSVEEDPVKIKILPYSDFYQDTEMLRIESGIESFSLTVDQSLLPNSVKVGYETFAKGNDTAVLASSNNDFLTTHDYLTAIKNHKGETRIISKWVASGHVIEEGKQQPYPLYSNEKWDKDNKTFVVATATKSVIYDQVVELWKLDRSLISLPDLYYWVIQNHLPQLENATSITFIDAPFSGPYTIDSVTLDLENNTTTVSITDDLGLTTEPTGKIAEYEHLNITSDITWTGPESDEPFDSVSGVADDKAIYNARISIKNMLYANSPVINSAFDKKNNTAKYTLTDFENNASLQAQFSAGENYTTLDPDRVNISQNSDLEIQQVNQGVMLFTPDLINASVRLSYANILLIKAILYGYITIVHENTEYKGFIKEMDYNPFREMVNFILRKKS